MTSRSSSPALKALQQFLLRVEDARGRLDHVAVLRHGRHLDHAAPEVAGEQLEAAGGAEGIASPDARRRCRATAPMSRHAQAARPRRRCGSRVYSRMPASRTVSTSSCIRPASSSSRITIARAAGRLELVHVGRAVGIDAAQQRHDGGQLGEVVPVDADAGGARHRDPVDQVVGRAAGRQQRRHRVDDGALVHHAADRRVAACLDDAQHGAHCFARQLLAQFVARIDERRARHVQAHRLHQHLVAVGRAVEGAGARRVIGPHLGVEQARRAPPGLAPPVRAPWPSRCWTGRWASARRARTPWAGGRNAGRRSAGPARSCRRCPASARASNTSWLRRHRGGHRDHVAREQAQLHAGACPGSRRRTWPARRRPPAPWRRACAPRP